MSTMVKKAGMPISGSLKSMFRTCISIRKPTTTSAGVAASDGTTCTSGVRNIAPTKSSPVTMLASPVRAPSPTPAADSM